MALPGGGVVSVPLDPAVANNPDLLPTAASAAASDVLTVPAGEPVTHFNLDQLLEIVQSFQLDTSMAAHDDRKAEGGGEAGIMHVSGTC